MFIFDILRQDGRRVQTLAGMVACGMLLLLAGLWWVQIVCGKQFEADLEKHSFRHVRTAALRGRIVDCTTNVLADDRPRYNAILHLEELQGQFADQFKRLLKEYSRAHPEIVNSKGKIRLPEDVRKALQDDANCDVVSNITYRVSMSLEEPRALNTKAFLQHYRDYPYVPFQIVPELTPRQVAIFAEQWSGSAFIELETQPVRQYPFKSLAANLLGYVRPDRGDSGDAKFAFNMPDFKGTSGVEYLYDDKLRGQPGANSVLINNKSYRQREEIETPDSPGNDIYLTIDADLQKAAEKALVNNSGQAEVRGAVVVMDPRNGDILALVSAPSYDPNIFVRGPTPQDMERLDDPHFTPQINRAIYGAYPPGSTFKIITAIACLETGLDPDAIYVSKGAYYPTPTSRPIGDEAGPGPYDLKRAFYRSSNTYFIEMGKSRIRKILEVAKRFHLGEKTGFSPRQESAGDVPGPEKVGPSLGMSIPDICIGQEITVTPLQMAGMISVIANGGTLYVPRAVSYSRSPATGEKEELVERGRVRDHVQMNPGDLERVRQAMLADTEQAPNNLGLGGTAYPKFNLAGQPLLKNFRVAGKTGTAEVKSPGSQFKKITWFDSYGPYEDPRYVVVVMVEDGVFGGPTCAPVAEKIYEAILRREQAGTSRTPSLAHN
ncbi:MAG TPA: penicillin-binding transpeptidase domain-containing protein [Candidatus Cybelea sp.]|nr:penicillin-binding transpeptidase domain-containing protein [Candidatus Cybelea sp.]